jgi:hypothetical protein
MDQATSTIAAVSLRTNGNTSNRVGNAITHEIAHAPSHTLNKLGAIPIPYNVLIIDTMQVMKMDRRKGITKLA